MAPNALLRCLPVQFSHPTPLKGARARELQNLCSEIGLVFTVLAQLHLPKPNPSAPPLHSLIYPTTPLSFTHSLTHDQHCHHTATLLPLFHSHFHHILFIHDPTHSHLTLNSHHHSRPPPFSLSPPPPTSNPHYLGQTPIFTHHRLSRPPLCTFFSTTKPSSFQSPTTTNHSLPYFPSSFRLLSYSLTNGHRQFRSYSLAHNPSLPPSSTPKNTSIFTFSDLHAQPHRGCYSILPVSNFPNLVLTLKGFHFSQVSNSSRC